MTRTLASKTILNALILSFIVRLVEIDHFLSLLGFGIYVAWVWMRIEVTDD